MEMGSRNTYGENTIFMNSWKNDKPETGEQWNDNGLQTE